MGHYERIAIAAGCLGIACSAWAQQQTIDLLPRVVQGVRGSYEEVPYAMNFDGSVIVGRASFSDAPSTHPFRWHETEGMQAIATGSPESGIAADVSSDGQTVLGYLGLKLFRWHQGTMTIHEPLGPGVPVTVSASSCDGLKAVGNATNGTAAFLWSLTEGTTILQPAVPGHECRVLDLSGNGQVALGWDSYQENFPAGPATRQTIATWTNGGGATLIGGLRSDPGNISQNGSIVSGWACTEFINANNYPQCNGDSIRISRWINGAESVMVPFIPSQIMPGEPLAMSGDGTVIGGSLYHPPGYILPRASIWRQDIGLVDLNTWLPTIGVNMNGWVLEYVWAISTDGSVLAGTGKYFGTQRAFRVKIRTDTDGDGLYDDWEVNGIPYAGPGCEVRRYILPGASPVRKDIYVEVDSMFGMTPSNAAMQRVIAAFDQAPVPAVSAPGALPGVALHVIVDESTVVPRTYTDAWGDFFVDKALHFGTITERADPYWSQIKEAKRQAYRYCIFAFELPNGVLGKGELINTRPAEGPRLGGNDIVIGLGNYAPPLNINYEDVQAATFMHELGHTLGLYHGGGDPHNNFCSNHISVMNYMWAGSRDFAPGTFRVLLDYSRYASSALVESSLDESVGINLVPGLRIPVVVRAENIPGDCATPPYPPTDRGQCDADIYGNGPRCVLYANSIGPVDWNNDGVINSGANRVCANPNDVTPEGDDPLGETYQSPNEWLLLAYNFRESPRYIDGVTSLSESLCPTYSFEQWASTLPPPPPIPCPGPAPTAAAPSPAQAISCSGQSVQVSVAPSGTGPFTVQWRWRDDSQNPPVWVNFAQGPMTSGTVVDGAQSGTLKLTTPNAADFGASSVAIDYTVVDACGLSATSAPGQLLLGTLVIAQTSPAVVAGCPGGNAVFSLTPDSTQFTYQWMSLAMSPVTFSNGRMRYGTLVSGASTANLAFSSINPLDFPAGPITLNCTLSGPCGSVTSPHFTFNPNGAVITTQPTDVNLACASAPQATFTVAASGDGPLTYQWKKSGATLSNGGRVSGATTATLTIANPVASDSGPYTCVVSSPCAAATSNAAALNVGVPTLINTPSIPPVCLGGTAHFYATAHGTQPLTYQWLRNGNAMNNGGGRSGTNTAHMTIANIAANDLSATYSVRVTNGCGQVTSATASLTLYQSVTIGTQPSNQDTCPNGAATLTAAPAVNQAGLTYAWSVENPGAPGSWIALSDGPMVIAGSTCGNIVGAATGTLTPTWAYHAPCAPSYRFRCTISQPCGSSATSTPATVTFLAGCCDSIDFNSDGLYPDTADIDDFLSVFSGAACSTGACGDIDFNNDGLFPDTLDIDSMLSVFSGGACL